MDTTRVNKFLSQSGFCSRREADSLIYEGRVTVNNKIIEPGFKVTAQDVVKVDGEIIKNRTKSFTYIAFNKPKGIVCTTDTKKFSGKVNMKSTNSFDKNGTLLSTEKCIEFLSP